MKKILSSGFILLLASANIAAAAVAEWDFDGLSQAPTTNSTISTSVETNTFGSGVTIGDFTLNESIRGSAFQRDRAEQGTNSDGSTMEFTITIDDTVTVDLTQLDFTYGFLNEVGNNITPTYALAFSQGSGTNASGSFPQSSDDFEETTMVGSVLSGLTGLTDTSVTFTWTFDSDEGRNFGLSGPEGTNRAHFIDDVSLSGAVIPEPSTIALVAISLIAFVGFRRRKK